MQNTEQWEALAIQVVGFLLADDKSRTGFLGATGLDGDELKSGLESPRFLVGVLEYLLSREDLLIEFCDSFEHDKMAPARALKALGGGDTMPID
ncbi:MAG: DUF3572 domain-containing protein [Rhodospirillales bacterium]|nr:DUF3572 domain-containing protein [Rhodospirillales bacterium]